MASGLEAKSLQGVEVGGLGTGVFVIQFTPIPVHQPVYSLPALCVLVFSLAASHPCRLSM